MGDMGEIFNFMRQRDRERRHRNLAKANERVEHKTDSIAWIKHTDVHWQTKIGPNTLDFWPSTNRFRYLGRTHVGDVYGFIKNQEKKFKAQQAKESKSEESPF